MMMHSYQEYQQPSPLMVNESTPTIMDSQPQPQPQPQSPHPKRAQTSHRHHRHHRHHTVNRSKSPRRAPWCKDCQFENQSLDTINNPDFNLHRQRTGKKDKKKSKKHSSRTKQTAATNQDIATGSYYYDDGATTAAMMQMTDRGITSAFGGPTYSTMDQTAYEGTYDGQQSMIYPQQQQQSYEQQDPTSMAYYQQNYPVRYQSTEVPMLPSNTVSANNKHQHPLVPNGLAYGVQNAFHNGTPQQSTAFQYRGSSQQTASYQPMPSSYAHQSTEPVGRYSMHERSLSPAGGDRVRSLSPAPLLEAGNQLVQQQRHLEHHEHHTGARLTLQHPQLAKQHTFNTGASEQHRAQAVNTLHMAREQFRSQEATQVGNAVHHQTAGHENGSFAIQHLKQQQHHQQFQHQQSDKHHMNISTTSQHSHAQQQIHSNQINTLSTYRSNSPTPDERKRTVLWDQRRVINARDLTAEHREIHREERQVQVVKPRVVIEDVTTNRTVHVPETVTREEIIEEVEKYQEKIIEVARPVITEKIVEVYEDDQFIENIIEDIHEVTTETFEAKEIETIHECINNVFLDEIEERIVEIPEIEIKNVDVYKTIEVPTIHEELVINEKSVNHYIDKPIPEVRTIKVEQDIARLVPVPIQQITTIELKLPKIVATYEKIRIPVYLPRFIEVPVAGDAVDESFRQKCDKICSEVNQLARAAQMQSVSLCKLESVGVEAKQWEVQIEQALAVGVKTQQERLVKLWKQDKMQVRHEDSIASLSTDDDFEEEDENTTEDDSSSPMGKTATTTRSAKSSSDSRTARFSLPVSDNYTSSSDRRVETQTTQEQHSQQQHSQQQQLSGLNAYSPIRGFVTAASQFRKQNSNSSSARRTVGSAVAAHSEVKIYRSKKTAARRTVGGQVIESDEQLIEDILEATGGRTPCSINMPTPMNDGGRRRLDFGLSSSYSGSHHDDDARSPLQISD